MENSPPTLADRLVLARSTAGLGQDFVAREIGMSQQSYSDLETGKSKSTTRIGSLANLYSVDAYWLETGNGPMAPLRVQDSMGDYLPERLEGRTPDERRLLRHFRLLSDRKKRAVLVLVDQGE